MTTNEIKNVEIILQMEDGTRLYGETMSEQVIDAIVDHVQFKRIMEEFSENQRMFEELISNENGNDYEKSNCHRP